MDIFGRADWLEFSFDRTDWLWEAIGASKIEATRVKGCPAI